MVSRKRCSNTHKKNLNSFNSSANEEKSTRRKTKKKLSEDLYVSHDTSSKNLICEIAVIPELLALKLDHYCSELASTHKDEYCDLADFEFNDGIENLERLREMREEISHKLKNFDFAGKTDVNLDGVRLAGAKVVVEERAATRSVTKKLTGEYGVEELDVLYSGLPYRGAEAAVAKDIHEQRTESIIESFVDFQKQLKFKLNVLGHAIKKVEILANSKSAILPDRLPPQRRQTVSKIATRGQSKRAITTNANRTPKKRRKIDPFSHNKIIDEYALEVASEVMNRTQNRRRNLAPIPFDLTVLDELPLVSRICDLDEKTR